MAAVENVEKLSCPVCTKIYESPKILPCNHIICHSCLKRHITSTINVGGYDLEELVAAQDDGEDSCETPEEVSCPVKDCGKTFRPPNCEKDIKCWADQFPNGLVVATIIKNKRNNTESNFCDFCMREGIVKEANVMCSDCVLRFCPECTFVHRYVLPSHNIIIWRNIDSSQMLQKIDLPRARPDLCALHEGKQLVIYCPDHANFCCLDCIASVHNGCCRLTMADKNSNQDLNGANLFQRLEECAAKVDKVRQDKERALGSLLDRKEEISAQLLSFKEHIDRRVLFFEKQILEQIATVHQSASSQVNEGIGKCNSINGSLMEIKSRLRDVMATGSDAEIAIEAHRLQSLCDKFEKNLSSIEGTMTIELNIDDKFQDMLDGMVTYCKVDMLSNQTREDKTNAEINVTERHDSKSFSTGGLATEKEYLNSEDGDTAEQELPPKVGCFTLPKLSTKKCFSINCKLRTDDSKCWLTDCSYLGNQCILVADNANDTIKLFLENGALKNVLNVDGHPWALDVRDDIFGAVTVPEKQKVVYFCLQPSLIKVSEFKVVTRCYGVAFIEDENVALTCQGNGRSSVKILKIDGTELREIKNDPVFRVPIFSHARYIKRMTKGSSNETCLVVSDSRRYVLTAIDLDGKEKFLANHRDLRHPVGLGVSSDGYFYVCACASFSLFRISESGHVEQTVLKDLVQFPRSISFHPTDNKFAVTQDCGKNQNYVQVFRVE